MSNPEEALASVEAGTTNGASPDVMKHESDSDTGTTPSTTELARKKLPAYIAKIFANFFARLGAILSGANLTRQSKRFEPLESAPEGAVVIGIVNDPVARELFTLWHELASEQRSCREGRNRVTYILENAEANALERCATIAEALFWAKVNETSPEINNSIRRQVCHNWQIVGAGDLAEIVSVEHAERRSMSTSLNELRALMHGDPMAAAMFGEMGAAGSGDPFEFDSENERVSLGDLARQLSRHEH